jgi:hypothetical protein
MGFFPGPLEIAKSQLSTKPLPPLSKQAEKPMRCKNLSVDRLWAMDGARAAEPEFASVFLN